MGSRWSPKKASYRHSTSVPTVTWWQFSPHKHILDKSLDRQEKQRFCFQPAYDGTCFGNHLEDIYLFNYSV